MSKRLKASLLSTVIMIVIMFVLVTVLTILKGLFGTMPIVILLMVAFSIWIAYAYITSKRNQKENAWRLKD